MRGTKGFPKAEASAGSAGPARAALAPDAASDDRSGWFVLHGAAASAVAALLSYQLTVLVVADGALTARPSINFAGLLLGLCAGVWTVLIGLLAWPVLNAQATRRARQHAGAASHPVARPSRSVAATPRLLDDPAARAIRRRGFSVLHVVAIGTAVPWIVLSLLLGSWQATTITIVVAVAAGAAGGFIAAWRVWRPNRMRAARLRTPVRSSGIGPALEHLPAAGADRRPLAFRSATVQPPETPEQDS